VCAISSLTSTFAISSPDEFLSYNGANGSESKTTHVSSSSSGGGTGGEVCRVCIS